MRLIGWRRTVVIKRSMTFNCSSVPEAFGLQVGRLLKWGVRGVLRYLNQLS